MANGYEVRGVLAARYKGKQEQRALVRHVLFDGAERTACGRVHEEHLCDVRRIGAGHVRGMPREAGEARTAITYSVAVRLCTTYNLRPGERGKG